MSDAPPVAVLAKLKLKEGTEEGYLDKLRVTLDKVREEPTSIFVHGYRDPQDPTTIMLVEIWTNAEAFQDFSDNTAYLNEYIETSQKHFWSEEPDISLWDEIA